MVAILPGQTQILYKKFRVTDTHPNKWKDNENKTMLPSLHLWSFVTVNIVMRPESLYIESKKGNMCFSKWDTAMLESISLSPGAQEAT